MINYMSTSITIIVIAFFSLCVPTAWGQGRPCSLDHYFFAQDDGKLFVDKQHIYRHGEDPNPPGPYPFNGYYQLAWATIYACWYVGEPGFSDTTDPDYGFPPEIELAGTPNVDYQIWFEVLDLSPEFKLRINDGTWLTHVGDRYNLSNWPEHHVHMSYRAYDGDAGTPPDHPHHVTYRLIDEIGPYETSEPFICVFNLPAPAVEATAPLYRATLPIQDAELSFTFHRAVTINGGPPATVTDEAEVNDYTDLFDYEVSGDGMTLTLNQSGGTLPTQEWLRVALTEHLLDANVADRPAVPFVQFVYTQLSGDLNCDGSLNSLDIDPFVLALTSTPPDYPEYYAEHPDCDTLLADCNTDGSINSLDIDLFVALLTGG